MGHQLDPGKFFAQMQHQTPGHLWIILQSREHRLAFHVSQNLILGHSTREYRYYPELSLVERKMKCNRLTWKIDVMKLVLFGSGEVNHLKAFYCSMDLIYVRPSWKLLWYC
uniref:Uncharacterized protein n=1 Tax=Romanomermis culicivorax TaxID=13658 RepID=A0A915IJ34_ROMCU